MRPVVFAVQAAPSPAFAGGMPMRGGRDAQQIVIVVYLVVLAAITIGVLTAFIK
jgi:hypothetical protein